MLYFGLVRERLGRREESVELADGATVAELLDTLAARYDVFALGAGSLRVAVNREYADAACVLAEGDEVAVIPPVAGGAPTDTEDAPSREVAAAGRDGAAPSRNGAHERER